MSSYERKSVSPFKLILRIVISIIIIAIQIAVYYFLFIGSQSIPYVYLVGIILSIILVIYIYNNNDNISYKMTWIIFILLFNVVGPIFYIIFGGGHNLPKRKYRKITSYLKNYVEPNDVLKDIEADDLFANRVLTLAHKNTGLYPYHNEGEKFFSDGALMFEEMLHAIDKAEKYIFIEYFIMASGKMLDMFIGHLEKCAERNVEIKIIYDYVGCNVPMVLSKKDLKRLRSIPNCSVETYNPISLNLNLGINYRDHRKILLVDGEIAFVGGINIADEYIHQKERFGFWRDNGMMIMGSPCYNYLLMFAQNWYLSSKEMLPVNQYKSTKKYEHKEGYVFPFGDGPNNRLNPSYDLHLQLINNAKKSICISTPYFVIDKIFIKALANQAKSGVDVTILVPDIPDKKIVYLMAVNNFDEIIDAGGKIYRYKNGFNHAKTLIVDDTYAIVGTFNIDYRSMFLHFECCNFLYQTEAIEEISKDFHQAIEVSLLIDGNPKKRNIFKRLLAFLLSLLGPLV